MSIQVGPFRLGQGLLDDVSGGAFASLYEATDDDGRSYVAKIPLPRGGGIHHTVVWVTSADGRRTPEHVPAVAFHAETHDDPQIVELFGPDLEQVLMSEAALLERDGGRLLPRSYGTYEMYKDGRAIPVLVMERLDGRRGVHSVAEVDAILVALDAAAERGTLPFHGDLKLEHVFFSADGRVRICDPAPRLENPKLRAFTPMYNPRGHVGPAADAAACATILRHFVPNTVGLWQWCSELLDERTPPSWASSHRSALTALREVHGKPSFPPPGWTMPALPDRCGRAEDPSEFDDQSHTASRFDDDDPPVAASSSEATRISTLRMQPTKPAGWRSTQSVTLIHPSGQVNLIASTEPVAVGIDSDTYADSQLQLLRHEFPGFVELSGGWLVLPTGQRARWRTFSWTPPDGVQVTQVQMYVAGDGEVHTATGTTTSNNWPLHEAAFFEILRTMEIHGDGEAISQPPSPPLIPPPVEQLSGERVRLSSSGENANDAVAPAEFERPPVTLGDVAGLDEVKQHIDVRLLAPLRNPEIAKRFGKTPSGGLLMWGPPGCGKTFVARAIAGSLDIDFCAIGLDEVLDMWIGSSERNLSAVFKAARAHAPAALFFDEVDAIGGRRSRTGVHVTARSLVSVLLTELDGAVRDNSGVFTIGATNLPWDVDPALRRPGRFDRTLFVPPPDRLARSAILAQRLSSVPLGTDIDLPRLTPMLRGLSGADVAAVVDRAVDEAFTASVASGREVVIDQATLERAAATAASSITDWIEIATTAAEASSDTDLYSPFLQWLNRADHEK